MKQFAISQLKFSELFWDTILTNAESFAVRKVELQRAMLKQDKLRPLADYNTGSIPFASSWLLYSLTSYFLPSKITEVGTFIGRSTLSMAHALDDNGSPGEIETCDHSNGFDLGWEGKTTIKQNFHTNSTSMLSNINTDQDFLFVDGRLTKEDITLTQNGHFDSCIFVFDDTEGFEKGAINQAMVQESFKQARYYIYPPSSDLMQKHNFNGFACISVSIPLTNVTFTRQG